MEALMVLVPISLVVSVLIVLIGYWANRSGQYDHIEEDAFHSVQNENIVVKNDNNKS
jgi:cbb3-type cytochrome oxidase maturation protein